VAELLLATQNRGKAREYRHLLAGIPYRIITPAEAGITAGVAETGATFEENAVLKATTLAAASGRLALADDSGLEVDALGGAPGVNSARFAGPGASDAERISLLLKKLKDVPEAARAARFRCVIAIAAPDGRVELASGESRGFITRAPRGAHGFGYDPVFYLPEMGKTMAELLPREKNKISHRARAAARARELLMGWR